MEGELLGLTLCRAIDCSENEIWVMKLILVSVVCFVLLFCFFPVKRFLLDTQFFPIQITSQGKKFQPVLLGKLESADHYGNDYLLCGNSQRSQPGSISIGAGVQTHGKTCSLPQIVGGRDFPRHKGQVPSSH